jgi:predicted amidohydrolase YtcJ
MKDPNESLIAVGFDQSMVNGEALTLQMLDSVSESRPIWVMQSNGHVGHANSAMLARAGVDRTTDEEGVARDANGEPTGEIRELALALFLGKHVELDAGGEAAIWDAGHLSRQVGCTMVTDLAYIPTLKSVDAYGTIVNNEMFPTRVRYAPNITFLSLRNDFNKTLELFKTLEQYNTDKFAMGPLKFIADGSIQGRTARMNWPGYCCGSPNGLWLGDPEKIYEQMLPFHEAGYQLALHTNGDEAIQAGLDIYQRLLETHPRFDHRHRLEHVQMATDAMFRRIKTLGVCVNLFANHLYYWGDTHRNDTMGPAKARHLDAVGTAVRMGIPHSIHSDAPVTPLDPLFTMWCAVNRMTSSGHVLGEAERISPMDALRAMTIGSAYLLNCDDEYGSIEVGKHADFAVLGADPSAVDPMEIKDIEVVATVLGGQVHSNRN